MHQVTEIFDGMFKHTMSGGISNHNSCNLVLSASNKLLNFFNRDVAVGIVFDRQDFITNHNCCGGVRSVS